MNEEIEGGKHGDGRIKRERHNVESRQQKIIVKDRTRHLG